MRHFLTYLTLIFSFLLGSHQGFIALWKPGSCEPEQVYPYSIASLPPADQQRLEKGIVLESEAQLRQLLEDYLS